jgi:penicillin-binding protein 1A
MNIFKIGVVIFIVSLSTILGGLLFVIHNTVIDFSVLAHYSPGKPSIVLDDSGNEWTRFQIDRREPIAYTQLPKHVIQAFIAAEDWDFFNHSGVSFKGIARSVLVNLYHGKSVQGASTITQQLVKLLFFDRKKTFKRKIKEQVVALLVEQQFTKEQILQTYVNHVCFGCGIYGVQAAAKRFWNKEVADLTIDQAAALAGIVRSPQNYCPLLCPLSTQKCKASVLFKMCKLGFITQEKYVKLSEQPIELIHTKNSCCAPHLRETLRCKLEQLVGKDQLYTGGLKIQTTLSQNTQRIAQQAFVDQVLQLKGSIDSSVDGALISIDGATGGIKALVGGYSFEDSKFNRALQAKRQVGSTFKPLVYAAAMQAGKSFADTKIDEPFELIQHNKAWKPRNFDRTFRGQTTLAQALSRSNNIVTIKTFLDVGAAPVIALAKKCKLPGPFHPYPSLALGCVDATLKDVVAMFNVFAHDGNYVKPFFIEWIKDKWGKKIYKHKVIPERVMGSIVVGKVAKTLRIGIERVKKLFWYSEEQWIPSEIISKTGTTNDSRTCWFAGSTPQFTTAIYIGCDDNRAMGRNVYPLRTAFPIWLTTHKTLPLEQTQFVFDPSLQEVAINPHTGEIVMNKDEKKSIKIFI